MENRLNKIFFVLPIIVVMLSSCSAWVEPEALDYGTHGVIGEKSQDYLSALRAFKQTDHKVMILRMPGTSLIPESRNQHIMTMPDSADFICVEISNALYPDFVAEISQVKSDKGTRCVSYVDFNAIQEVWNEQEEAKGDGQVAGTVDDFVEFCAEQTRIQLGYCDSYGFDGIMFSFQGNISSEMAAAGQKVFLESVQEWRMTHQNAWMFARGSLSNISDDYKDILFDCDYTVLVSSSESSAGQLNTMVNRFIRNGDVPSDRIVVEVSVPSEENPAPACATPQTAAEWIVEPSEAYVKCGICVGNAQDDYLVDTTFGNIRKAISILNGNGSQDPEEPDTNL